MFYLLEFALASKVEGHAVASFLVVTKHGTPDSLGLTQCLRLAMTHYCKPIDSLKPWAASFTTVAVTPGLRHRRHGTEQTSTIHGILEASMALALNRESFVWHKIHSLTGIIPVGFYMLQHLTLNSFSWAGERYFNAVIDFFGGMPWYLLIGMEIALIWVPLLFHAVYGLFITNRGEVNYWGTRYGWSQNRMYTLQRYSGVFLFLFLTFHVSTTTVNKYIHGDDGLIKYAQWQQNLTQWGHVLTLVYILGVAAASYHLAYGVWNFCIRWGITVSEKAQARIQKFSFWMFIVVTLLGWLAIAGFYRHTVGAPVSV